jgi:PAS domain S-box-containing protein
VSPLDFLNMKVLENASADVLPAEPRSRLDFRTVFEALPGMFVVLDPTFRVLAVSNAYATATLTDRDTVIGRELFEVFPENTHLPDAGAIRQLRASLERVQRTGKADAMVLQRYDLPRPESAGGGFEERYWSWVASPLLAANGKLAQLILRVEDVTDYVLLTRQGSAHEQATDDLRWRAVQVEAELYARSREVAETTLQLKKANEELARLQGDSRDRYRNLFNAIDEGFCTMEVLFDENGSPCDYRFLEVNPAFSKHTGLLNAEGRRMRELEPEIEEHWVRIYGEVALTGRPVRFIEFSVPMKRWFEVYAFRVGAPELRQVALLFSDVTESRRAVLALRESEERFRAVADNIPQLAWMTDADGNILWFNRRWIDYTGLGVEEMQLLGWQEVHHPDHPTAVVEGWQRALNTGTVWEDTFPLRGRDGTYRWFLSRAFPIRDGQGRITQWFGTNTDITPLRAAEAALHGANEDLQRHAQNLETLVAERTAQLSENVQELEAFSYSLSHDMRAPLRAMQGYAQILEKEHGQSLPPEGQMMLRRIANAGARLDQLIRDVLTYSRVVREQVSLGVVDPSSIIRNLVEENSTLQPPSANIAVCEPLDEVCGHEAYLMQVLSNLLFNAVKFVAPGRQPQVHIWTETCGDHVDLFVRDNGVGIPREARERLFGMFERFHQDRAYEGTGIGLAIVRKAVERMGGSVRVESAPGEGSTFIVRLNRPAA